MFKYQLHKLTKGEKEARTVLLEDILTSDVFGLMSYYPYDLLLKPFLEQVAQRNPKSDFWIPDIEPLKFQFWKNFDWPDSLPKLDRDSIEPDVIIEWNGMLLIIEAKFISPTEPEELLREFLIGMTETYGEQKFFLLLIDKNLSPPNVAYLTIPERIPMTEYILNRIQELNLSKNFSPQLINSSVLWINWQSFYVLVEKLIQLTSTDNIVGLRQMGKKILKDLLLVLDRKGLTPFEKLSLINFEKFLIDLSSLDEIGLMMRSSFSDLSDITIDLNALSKIGSIIDDPVSFLLDINLYVEDLFAYWDKK